MTRALARLGVPRLWHDDPDLLWYFLRARVAPVVTWLAPSHGYGVERIPREGGIVVAANHFSAVDHPVLAALCPRPVAFLSKAELLARPVVGEALAWTGALPVHRGAPDRAALRRARDLAAAGQAIGVHLEGTRQQTGRPGEFKAGAVVVAMQARVPVVPCGLDTFGWSPWSRRPCVAVFGEPLDLSGLPRGRCGHREGAEIVGDAVVALWRQACAARAGGFPDELPDGARRAGRAPPGPHPNGARIR